MLVDRRSFIAALSVSAGTSGISVAQISDAEAQKIIDSALTDSEALLEETIRLAESRPLTENFDPFNFATILPARRDRILDSLQTTFENMPPARWRPLMRPEYSAFISLAVDFGGPIPTRTEVRTISRPDPRSQRRRTDRVLEAIFRFIGIEEEDVIDELIKFSRESPILGPYVREIEDAIGSDNFRRVVRAIFRFMRAIATDAFLALWQRLLSIGARSIAVRVIRRFAARFIPVVGELIIVAEIANFIRSIYIEVRST